MATVTGWIWTDAQTTAQYNMSLLLSCPTYDDRILGLRHKATLLEPILRAAIEVVEPLFILAIYRVSGVKLRTVLNVLTAQIHPHL
jgi:hypothetical protein